MAVDASGLEVRAMKKKFVTLRAYSLRSLSSGTAMRSIIHFGTK